MKPTVSEIIRTERKRLGWSQKKLAEKAGLNYNTIYYLESNKSSPKVETCKKLCKVLGISISQLLE